MKKFSTRTEFRESLGASCKNPQWSWSWVNHEQRSVYFGASRNHEIGNSQLILGCSWSRNHQGVRSKGYGEAREYIDLVLKDGYSLYTFRQIEKVINKKTGKVKIVDFEQDLERRFLVKKRDGWYAVPLDDFEEIVPSPQSEEKIVYLEGSNIPIFGSRVERNPRARRACLEYHGTTCCICGFDFKERYGTLGEDFIHVHHVKPLSASDGEHEVCPRDDLRPVCPNCHAMIHRNGQNRSIEEIRALLS